MPQLTGPRQILIEHTLWQRLRAFQQGSVMNGGVDSGVSTQTSLGNYTGNTSGQWLNVTSPGTPDTEFAISHDLGRIPSSYWYISDQAAKLYQLPNTGTAWSTTKVYFKCDTASVALRIFIQ